MNLKRILAIYKKIPGKIGTRANVHIRSRKDLSIYYTPGVGIVADYLARHKSKTRDYTLKSNAIAIVSDGSAVLGLGNIGPEGAIPVMEGKALLYKEFADIDAFPIVLNTQDIEEVIKTVAYIAPVFGGIHLEDISAPRCFEIQDRLRRKLSIPVMHDDQDASAVVVLAGLINAFKVVKKDIRKSKIVIIGAGAAGYSTAKLISFYLSKIKKRKKSAHTILVVDRKGIINKKRGGLNKHKKELAKFANLQNITGSLDDALRGADAVIGLSSAKMLKKQHIQSMAEKPIVFALANPVPEIMPEEAKQGNAFVVATGRSDFPNQVNNALAFPGIFRGTLDNRIKQFKDEMFFRAARSLAACVKHPTRGRILPSPLNKSIVPAIKKEIY